MLRRLFLTFRTSSLKKIQSNFSIKRDSYNALHLTPTQPLEKQEFQDYITHVVNENQNGTSSIWLHLKHSHLSLIDSLVNIFGFKIHRGIGSEVSLYRWMRKNKVDLVPPYSMCIISCGGVIIHNNKILLAREKAGSLKGYYGIPGGRADREQALYNCVEREIWQQVGLKGKFKQILWCRELSGYVYGSSDMYFACLVEVREEQLSKLKICEEEIQLVQWVHLSQLSNFMSTRSVGTQKRLGNYLQRLYKEGYDFKRQTNFKYQLYTSPIDGKQRFFGQHFLTQYR